MGTRTTYSLKIGETPTEILIPGIVQVKRVDYSIVTAFSARTLPRKVRHVNRKMPIEGTAINCVIKDISQFFPILKKLRDTDARKASNNSFTVTIDGVVVYSESPVVPNLTGGHDLENKPNRMSLTITLTFETFIGS